MLITLRRRHHGVHEFVKEVEIPGQFDDYCVLIPWDGNSSDRQENFKIDEEKLLAALPARFLPVKPGKVLLSVDDQYGGTGQRGLNVFLNWAKYFDAYCLSVQKDQEGLCV